MKSTRLLPLAVLLLAGCAERTTTEPVLVDKASQCPAHLAVGQTLTLSLPSNPTTGYRWQVTDRAAPVLRSLGPEVYSNPEDAGIVGSAGVSTWRFQASAAGTAKLHLIYQQPWAPEVKPAKVFDCEVRVR